MTAIRLQRTNRTGVWEVRGRSGLFCQACRGSGVRITTGLHLSGWAARNGLNGLQLPTLTDARRLLAAVIAADPPPDCAWHADLPAGRPLRLNAAAAAGVHVTVCRTYRVTRDTRGFAGSLRWAVLYRGEQINAASTLPVAQQIVVEHALRQAARSRRRRPVKDGGPAPFSRAGPGRA